MISCKNCGTAFSGNYCPHCGQKHLSDRYTLRKLLWEAWAVVTNVEQGFWYTTKTLFLNPALIITDYIKGKTKPYYNPLRYLIIWAVLSITFIYLGGFVLLFFTFSILGLIVLLFSFLLPG